MKNRGHHVHSLSKSPCLGWLVCWTREFQCHLNMALEEEEDPSLYPWLPGIKPKVTAC